MDSHATSPTLTVSNLVPVYEEPARDGGGSFDPAHAAAVVEQVVEHAVVVEQASGGIEPRVARLVSPPEHFDVHEPIEPPSSFSYDELLAQDAHAWSARRATAAAGDEALPEVDYDALRRRDIAKELLRARLIGLAEQRERRSAYEIAFLMLVAAVAVLLAAPPLVQVLLAAHGTQA